MGPIIPSTVFVSSYSVWCNCVNHRDECNIDDCRVSGLLQCTGSGKDPILYTRETDETTVCTLREPFPHLHIKMVSLPYYLRLVIGFNGILVSTDVLIFEIVNL